MRIITDFADQAVILPTVAMVLLTLLWLGWRRAAWAWAGVTGGTLLTMAVLKVVFAACGPEPGPGMLADPSGHTAAAAAVYGGAIGLLLRGTLLRRMRFGGGLPWLEAGLAGLLLAGLIGTSRVLLGAHSVPDVIAGGLLGTASALLLARLAGPPQLGSAQRRWLLAPLVAVPLLLHGFHLNAEPRIKSVATFWPLSACRTR
jgi:membrane-associated phospholipid phosphatase